MATVQQWLAELGCEQYCGVFEGSGYRTVDSLSSLDDSTLLNIGVLDSNHRRAILHKASGSVDEDFDAMLGELGSVIKDLEMFSVPTHIDASALPTNTVDPAMPNARRDKPRASLILTEVPKPVPTQEDFDLDSLLSDLTSFNPSDVVASTHPLTPSHQSQPPQQPPQPQFTPPQQPSPARVRIHSSSSGSTPVHAPAQGQWVTPPDTPERFGARAQTTSEFDHHRREEHKPDVRARSLSESRPQEDSEEPTVVTVPQPDLVGTNKEYSHEAVQRRISEKALELRNDVSLTEDEREQKLKEEKMRIGIEKMRLAHKKRVAIKVFNPDRSNKTVVVEEGMTTSMVCHLLVVKNHFDESPNWVLVEQLGDVSLERELEDHESVVDVYSSWPREHNNVFLFKQNEKKYDLFEDPIKYFPDHLRSSQASTTKQSTLQRTEKARKILLQEYFSSTSRVPELEGYLHLKDGYKKSWKKVYCILRASGLYYSLKGKNKTAKHLVLLVQFEDYELFHGINFKKTLKSPTQFCFALRPLPRQFVPGPKDIKVLCADEEPTALSWTAGIRLAKYGLQLRDNFHKAKMTQFKLEDLAAGDSASPSAENRASKLVGLRLEKHLDKLRQQYEQQKQEEEDKRNFFRASPNVSQRSENTESDPNANSQIDVGSTPPSEPSPQPSPEPQRSEPPKPAPKPAPKPRREHKQQGSSSPQPPNGDVPPSPRFAEREGPSPQERGYQQRAHHSPERSYQPPTPERSFPQQPAPPERSFQQHPPPDRGYQQGAPPPPPERSFQPSPPDRGYPPTPTERGYNAAPYNPYPAPSQPAPPPRESPDPRPGSQNDRLTPDKEALFSFAWYHGSIPRDEAVARLSAVGGFDGAYLVRDSTTVQNSYVLTMFAKSVAKNFQILPMEHRSGMIMYRIDDGPPFASVEQLLRHYKTGSDRLPCRLTEFCPRPPTRTTEC